MLNLYENGPHTNVQLAGTIQTSEPCTKIMLRMTRGKEER